MLAVLPFFGVDGSGGFRSRAGLAALLGGVALLPAWWAVLVLGARLALGALGLGPSPGLAVLGLVALVVGAWLALGLVALLLAAGRADRRRLELLGGASKVRGADGGPASSARSLTPGRSRELMRHGRPIPAVPDPSIGQLPHAGDDGGGHA